jgi:hypothetical protein
MYSHPAFSFIFNYNSIIGHVIGAWQIVMQSARGLRQYMYQPSTMRPFRATFVHAAGA